MPVFAPDVVQAPAVDLRRGGLLSVADVRNEPNGKWEFGLDWQPDTCGMAHLTPHDCVDGPSGAKAFDGVSTVLSKSFATYKGVVCDYFGRDRYAEKARKGLEFSEAEAVERYFALNVLSGALDLTPTPGTGVAAGVALGILEEWTAEHYGGVATLHADRLVTTFLDASSLLLRDPVNLRTAQGSLLANGAYQAPVEAGKRWLWATGQVVLYKGQVIDREASDTIHNKHYALAERPWAVGVECFVVGVLVTVTGAPAVTAPPADKKAAQPGDVFTDATVTNAATLNAAGYVAAPQIAWLPGWYITVGTAKYTWTGAAWAAYSGPDRIAANGPFGTAFDLPFRGVL